MFNLSPGGSYSGYSSCSVEENLLAEEELDKILSELAAIADLETEQTKQNKGNIN